VRSIPRLARRPLTWAVTAVAVLLAALPAAAAGQTPPPAPLGTPVLGASFLGPSQIAAWYAATGIRSRSPTGVARIARLFVDEGLSQGVRGDLAFAQAMLETGYLRFGGQVLPADHNFGGIGACDSCARGLRFPDPETGIRAHIQHLWAYASPTADPAALARPLADVRFGRVQPPGKTPLWEMMGGGNWATGPDYARKVLTIWTAMLTWNGVAPPLPVPVPGAAPQGPLLVRTSAAGAANLAGWRLRRENLAGGVARLGAPASRTRGGGGCLARWPAVGAAILVRAGGDPCASDGAVVRWARVSSPIWRTQRGLAPGDALERLRDLYPKARLRAGRWWLVTGRRAGAPAPRLRAEVRAGRVRALWVDVG